MEGKFCLLVLSDFVTEYMDKVGEGYKVSTDQTSVPFGHEIRH